MLATMGQNVKEFESTPSGISVLRHEPGSIAGEGNEVDVIPIHIKRMELRVHGWQLRRRDKTGVDATFPSVRKSDHRLDPEQHADDRPSDR
ncbi:hypothetical protein KBY82_09770 [Cyanobium sp. AMD-g]|uniref:hypothetical protein n=1 Tax=Cyanobium sp. AMD-g TaxID=2823699 RepID=UPI0020CE95BC|nr:hypothetical protein [Cyanobium sp. AMD-g]MCP9931072.1 hypothetical protein [Cyanobium sp. AMD-g]